MKIIFLGTPDFATSVLADLINSKHEIVAVVTQPDKPTGRSGKLKFPPVKQLALEHNLKVFQFKNIKKVEAINELKNLNADLMVTAAYGQILSQDVLNVTQYGVLNVHGSLLPKYRGAAPIQWAIINGDKVTGITIMKTNVGMDTGDMLLKKEIEIRPQETAGELFERMSDLGGKVLLEAIELIETGQAKYEKQDESKSSHFPMLKKQDGLIDWKKDAKQIVNLIHGVNPWPGAFTYLNGQILKVHKASHCNGCSEIITKKIEEAKPGQVVISNPKIGLLVKAGKGAVKLSLIQTFGAKKMSDKDFLNGKKIEEGILLGE